jgi:DNA-directed RNA polymerase specialized sigma24 family protein
VERNTELARSSPEGSALHPTQKPKDPQPKLPPKKNDFSQYLNNGNLTDRQRECFSLKWEYGLPVTKIADRLGISRKTVDEHLAFAQNKINKAQSHNRRVRNEAKSGAS